MLIECPECHNQISDASDMCIHCGYPIKRLKNPNLCVINGVEYDLTNIINTYNQDNGNGCLKARACRLFSDMTSVEIVASVKFVNQIIADGKVPSEFNGIVERIQPRIQCPTCHSTSVKRISTTAKVTNTAMFGLFGQKRKHQFQCQKCHYEW